MIESLTKEDHWALTVTVDRWAYHIGRGCQFRAQKTKTETAIDALYRNAGLPTPPIEHFGSPYGLMKRFKNDGFERKPCVKKLIDNPLDESRRELERVIARPVSDEIWEHSDVIHRLTEDKISGKLLDILNNEETPEDAEILWWWSNLGGKYLYFFDYCQNHLALRVQTPYVKEILDAARLCGAVYFDESICLVSSLPLRINVDQDGDLHDQEGKFALLYRDGFFISAQHGEIACWGTDGKSKQRNSTKQFQITHECPSCNTINPKTNKSIIVCCGCKEVFTV